MPLPRTRRFATLRRSLRLLASFRHEQSAPAKFYGALAQDTRMLIDALLADTCLLYTSDAADE